MTVMSLEGDEAVGKTSLAYTGPLPIVGFAYDMGWERALHGSMYKEWFEGLKIEGHKYTGGQPPKDVYTGADITIYECPQVLQIEKIRIRGQRELWEYFLYLVAAALRSADVETIVIDTATVAREVKGDAFLQSLQEETEEQNKRENKHLALRERLNQFEWANPNGAIRDLYTNAQGVGKNLIAIHHLGDEYKMMPSRRGDGSQESQPTGNRILKGLSDTYKFMDIALRLTKEPVPVDPFDHSKGTRTGIKARFKKCGFNLSMENSTEILDPTWNGIMDVIALNTPNALLDLPRRAERTKA